MIEEKIAYVVNGQTFFNKELALSYEKELEKTSILNKKESYVKRMLIKSVYGDLFSDPSYKNQERINPVIQILFKNTDLVQEIINNLKQNKWD